MQEQTTVVPHFLRECFLRVAEENMREFLSRTRNLRWEISANLRQTLRIGSDFLVSNLWQNSEQMNPNLVQISRKREGLERDLWKVRQLSVNASRDGDFRTVARLTLEAARLNRAIADTELSGEMSS
jgi:hypothetical protein